MEDQERLEDLRRVWALQGFGVVAVDTDTVADRRGRGVRVKVVRLRDERRGHRCPQCGRWHAVGAFQEMAELQWRDRSLGDLAT